MSVDATLPEGALQRLREALTEGLKEVLVPGMTVGPYRIEAKIGRGGSGVVYRAHDATLQRAVALKVLRPELLDGVAAQRLRREALAVARLKDPGIVTVYEVGEIGDSQYIAMEYIEGQTLAAVLSSRRLPPAEACLIVERIARALGCAHRNGVIHRDIKPHNIILRPDGHPVITDFGLAKFEGAETRITQPGYAIGTPMYMSPEQVRGDGPLDGRTDIYSCGVILFEALMGRLPFQGNTPLAVYHNIVETEIPPLRGIPVELSWVMLKCLQKDSRDRYPTADELGEDLRRWRAGEGVQAGPPAPMTRAVRAVRRNPLFTMIAALVLVAGLGAVAMYRASQRRETSDAHFLRAVNLLQRAEGIPPTAEEERRAVLREARLDLDRALEARPDHGAVLQQRGRVSMLLGENERALADLDRAIALDPDDAMTYFTRARVRMREYQVRRPPPRMVVSAGGTMVAPAPGEDAEATAIREKASRDLEAAARLYPAGAEWEERFGAGVLLLYQGRYREAVGAFDQSLACLPANGEALFYRGMAKTIIQDGEGGLADLDRAAQIGYTTFAAKLYRGIACYLRADYAEAIHSFDEALERRPEGTQVIAYRALARVNLVLNRPDQAGDALSVLRAAIEDFTKRLDDEPGDADTLGNRAWAFHVLAGRLENRGLPCREEFEAGVRDADLATPDGSPCAFGLGERGNRWADYGDFLRRIGESPEEAWARGIACYERALRVDPKWNYARAGLAHRCLVRAKWRKGVPAEDLAKAVDHAEACLRDQQYVDWMVSVCSEAYALWIAVESLRLRLTSPLLERAVATLDRCIAMKPEDDALYMRRGAILVSFAAFEEFCGRSGRDHRRRALADYERASELDPSRAEGLAGTLEALRRSQ
ncbi:MAG: protein kinase [Planctomycetes bacterium]|nr:protein kinase [Planctomycetota bacterium]